MLWDVSGESSPEAEGAAAGSGQSHAFISLAKKYQTFQLKTPGRLESPIRIQNNKMMQVKSEPKSKHSWAHQQISQKALFTLLSLESIWPTSCQGSRRMLCPHWSE